jgi:aspartyl-tRNA(Asn)/glutamyl-tRNA(Gln) amidotransferase subunit A
MYKLSALEITTLFKNKKISAVEIVNYFLKRIEKNDSLLKAFITVLKDRALKKAAILDEKIKNKKPLGNLAGIPVIIKDSINIKGEITTCGSEFLKNYKALSDASIVKFLEEEDAIIIGKSNLDEFTMGSSTENSAFFPTKNPWNLKCVPGGSSGGSAAAVAARLSPLAIGSDTGGSIRQPAAFCGILGFKPTYGRVSRFGLIAFASSFDQLGPFATNAKDIALIMQTLEKPCKKDSTNLGMPIENHLKNLKEDLKNLKIGVPWHFLENLKEEANENFKQSVETLKNLGAEIIDIDLDILRYSIAVYYILAPAEASTNLAKFDGVKYGIRSKKAKTIEEVYSLSRDENFGPEVKRRIMLGTYVLSSGFQSAYYKKAQKVRTLIIKAFENSFETCDLIALPTSPFTAFELNTIKDPVQLYLQDLFTVSANLAGLPGISIPSGFDKGKKPFGLQLLGPQLHDALVIASAHAFEKATKFSKMIPPIFDKE